MERLDRFAKWLREFMIPLVIGLLGGPYVLPNGAKPAPPAAPPCQPPAPPPAAPAPGPIPAPPPSPAALVDPEAATVKFHTERSWCTATLLADRPGPGRYYVLCAAHCVRGGVRSGSIAMKDGRSFAFRIIRTNATADVALCEIDGPEGLPVAQIADSEPAPGTAVWHMGYGIDRPGNKEVGSVVSGPGRTGQLAMRLSVSNGDSGSGIFRTDNGQLVSVVCCSGGGMTYGGGVAAIRRLLLAMADSG
jgi:hypothetical protein